MARIKTIQLFRGVKANIPTSGLNVGEPIITTDTQEFYVAKSATEKYTPTPDIESLPALASPDAANDTIMIYDADTAAGNPKAKKITINAIKTAMNIPASDSDEKVAIISGGAAGYLGSNGSDGILRVDTTMTMTKDAGNGFVTLSAVPPTIIDGGTF